MYGSGLWSREVDDATAGCQVVAAAVGCNCFSFLRRRLKFSNLEPKFLADSTFLFSRRVHSNLLESEDSSPSHRKDKTSP
jgi:hypothetical protein